MKFRIGALALDRAGIEHFVAGLEQSDIRPDGVDHAGCVVAENFGFAFRRRGALAHLGIDGVHRHRLDRDADVAGLRFRLGGLEIDQRFRVLDGEGLFVSDGLHPAFLLV